MKAPHDMRKGMFLWWSDFVAEDGGREVKIPKGCEMITIRVDPNISLGQVLQPGGYVNIRGLFDTGVDPRNPRIESLDVMKNVQVRGLNGSPIPVAGRTDITNIQIIVPSEQARKLLQIQGILKTGHFAIGEVSAPDATSMADPAIEKEVLALLNRPRAPAATGGAALPPPPDTTPAPGPVPVVP